MSTAPVGSTLDKTIQIYGGGHKMQQCFGCQAAQSVRLPGTPFARKCAQTWKVYNSKLGCIMPLIFPPVPLNWLTRKPWLVPSMAMYDAAALLFGPTW